MPSTFTRLFQERLRLELGEKAKGYEIYPCEKWLQIRRRRVVHVDIALKSADTLVLLEIESHRQDPSNNVAKISLWLERNPSKRKIIIIQLFSPFYDKHDVRRAVAEHLGKLVMERFAEHLLYKAFSMKISFDDFERLYKNPKKNENMLDKLVCESASKVVEWLADTKRKTV